MHRGRASAIRTLPRRRWADGLGRTRPAGMIVGTLRGLAVRSASMTASSEAYRCSDTRILRLAGPVRAARILLAPGSLALILDVERPPGPRRAALLPRRCVAQNRGPPLAPFPTMAEQLTTHGADREPRQAPSNCHRVPPSWGEGTYRSRITGGIWRDEKGR